MIKHMIMWKVEGKEALEYYQKHEKHQYVANHFVRPFTISQAVVDYEY